VKASILYNLFTALRKEERLVAGGIGEYLLLEEQLTREYELNNFEDFVFICELLLVKNKSEQTVFRSIINNWKADIEKYIIKQYDKIEKLKKRIPIAATPQTKTEAPAARTNLATSPDARARQQPPVEPLATNRQNTEAGVESQEKEEHAEEVGESEITFSLTDETAADQGVGKAIKPVDSGLPADPDKQFLLGNEYFPVANRSLRQNWRTLKNRQHVNEYGTVDLAATINEITRTGLFLDFQYRKKTTNLLSLFIFIDRGNSMIAFEAFGKELAESAFQSGLHLEIKPWYFHDVPDKVGEKKASDYLLFNEEETEAKTLAQLFMNLNKKNIVTLVYGDAGALSPGDYGLQKEREKNTIEFLRYLLRNTAYTAWLNPAPRHRWQHTMAETVSNAFPEAGMFEANGTGFEQAINALRGKITIK
jgi:uncharacterized protein with von Willebrand factor type A (vWA) domain